MLPPRSRLDEAPVQTEQVDTIPYVEVTVPVAYLLRKTLARVCRSNVMRFVDVPMFLDCCTQYIMLLISHISVTIKYLYILIIVRCAPVYGTVQYSTVVVYKP